jgi:hypothetical protein
MSDEDCRLTVSACTFQGNGAEHGGAIEIWRAAGGSVTGCHFSGNSAAVGGAVLHRQSLDLPFSDCTFEGNAADEEGGAFALHEGDPDLGRCTFTGNSAPWGGAVVVRSCTGADISACSFADNTAQLGGGIALVHSGAPVVIGCTLAGNEAQDGGGIAAVDCAAPLVASSTLVLNRATGLGGGVMFRRSEECSIVRAIVAFSENGEAVGADGADVVCATTAVYGNAGGDWVGAIAGQGSFHDNIAADPLLCGMYLGDNTLCEDSPCLPENNSAGALVGALGQGCDGPCGLAVVTRSWGSIKAMYR